MKIDNKLSPAECHGNMEITDIIIFPIKKNAGNIQAYCKIILNDALIINGITVHKNDRGILYIKFPQEINKRDNKGYDICFPVRADLRVYISDKILEQYKIILNEGGG